MNNLNNDGNYRLERLAKFRDALVKAEVEKVKQQFIADKSSVEYGVVATGG